MPHVVSFRVDAALSDELTAYAAEIGVTPHQAARLLVEAGLGVHGGKSAKDAGLRAAITHALNRVSLQGHKALSAGLDEARERMESAFGLEDDR